MRHFCRVTITSLATWTGCAYICFSEVFVLAFLAKVSPLDQSRWLVAILFNWFLSFVVVPPFVVALLHIRLRCLARQRPRGDPAVIRMSLDLADIAEACQGEDNLNVWLMQTSMKGRAANKAPNTTTAQWLLLEAHRSFCKFILELVSIHQGAAHLEEARRVDAWIARVAGPTSNRFSFNALQTAPQVNDLAEIHSALLEIWMCSYDGEHVATSLQNQSLLEIAGSADLALLDAYISAPRAFFSAILADRHLHRAIPAAELVQGIGHLFVEGSQVSRRSADNVTAWYSLSFEVSRTKPLLGFISHSWASSGRLKALNLALHFENRRATLACATVMWVCVVASLVLWTSQTSQDFDVRVSYFRLVVGGMGLLTTVMHLLFIFYSYKALPCGHTAESGYFLDISCIRQDSPEDIRRGVMHLTEYLMVSSELIVLWTPKYSKRLWCVCELATFFRRVCLLEHMSAAGEHCEVGNIAFLPLWAAPLSLGFSYSVLVLLVLMWYTVFVE